MSKQFDYTLLEDMKNKSESQSKFFYISTFGCPLV